MRLVMQMLMDLESLKLDPTTIQILGVGEDHDFKGEVIVCTFNCTLFFSAACPDDTGSITPAYSGSIPRIARYIHTYK